MELLSKLQSLFIPLSSSESSPSSTPSSTTSTTLSYSSSPLLPPEILIEIFSSTYPTYTVSDCTRCFSQRHEALSRYALLSSEWRSWAQQQLFRHPYVIGDEWGRKLIEVLGRRRDLRKECETIHCWGDTEVVVGKRFLNELLGLVGGVKTVCLVNFKFDLMDLVGLNDLIKFNVQNCIIRTPSLPLPSHKSLLSLPKVTHLVITECTILGSSAPSFFNPTIFPSVIAFHFSPILLVDDHPDLRPSYNSIINSFTPQVRFLSDAGGIPNLDDFTELRGFQIRIHNFDLSYSAHWPTSLPHPIYLRILLEPDKSFPLNNFDDLKDSLEKWLAKGMKVLRVDLVTHVTSVVLVEKVEAIKKVFEKFEVDVDEETEMSFLQACDDVQRGVEREERGSVKRREMRTCC